MDKRRKFGYDEDHDKISDEWERDVGLHDPETNKPRHFMMSNLPSRGSIVAIHHDHLHTITQNNGGKMCLTIKTPKPMKLCINMDGPELKSDVLGRAKIPKAVLHDEKIRKNNSNFSEDWINDRIRKILHKKKKVK